MSKLALKETESTEFKKALKVEMRECGLEYDNESVEDFIENYLYCVLDNSEKEAIKAMWELSNKKDFVILYFNGSCYFFEIL